MTYGIINVVKDLAIGKLQFVDKSTIEHRQSLCKNCDVRNRRNICTACGCWLPAKTRLKQSECPLALW